MGWQTSQPATSIRTRADMRRNQSAHVLRRQATVVLLCSFLVTSGCGASQEQPSADPTVPVSEGEGDGTTAPSTSSTHSPQPPMTTDAPVELEFADPPDPSGAPVLLLSGDARRLDVSDQGGRDAFFFQSWFDPGANEWLELSTHSDHEAEPFEQSISNWTYEVNDAAGLVELRRPNVTVYASATGMAADEVLTLMVSARWDSNGGWRLAELPGSYRQVAHGVDRLVVVQDVQLIPQPGSEVATELRVLSEAPSILGPTALGADGADIELLEVDTQSFLVARDPRYVSVVWRIDDGPFFGQLLVRGEPSDAQLIALIRSLRPGEPTDLDALPLYDSGDGCVTVDC